MTHMLKTGRVEGKWIIYSYRVHVTHDIHVHVLHVKTLYAQSGIWTIQGLHRVVT